MTAVPDLVQVAVVAPIGKSDHCGKSDHKVVNQIIGKSDHNFASAR